MTISVQVVKGEYTGGRGGTYRDPDRHKGSKWDIGWKSHLIKSVVDAKGEGCGIIVYMGAWEAEL